MSPNFLPDGFVFSISHWRQFYQVGDVILVNHSTYGKMIKRIFSIETSNSLQKKSKKRHQNDIHLTSSIKIQKKHIKTLHLVGDNSQSVTTEQMGVILPSEIIGKVVYQVKPS